jgi:hypothetical protein
MMSSSFRGTDLAGTQADVSQQPRDGPVADAGRSRQVRLKEQPLVLSG